MARSIENYWSLLVKVLASAIFFGIIGFVLYIGYCDMNAKVRSRQEDTLFQIAKCKADYAKNKCGPDVRIKELDTFCAETERCMNRDPYKVLIGPGYSAV